MNYVVWFIGGVIAGISFIIIGNLLLERKERTSLLAIVNILILGLITVALNLLTPGVINGIIKISTNFIFCIYFYRTIFKISFSKGIILSLLSYLAIFIGEVISVLIFLVFMYLLSLSDLEGFFNSLIVHCIITLISILVIYFNISRFRKIMSKDFSEKKVLIGLAILILLTTTILLFRIPVSAMKFDYNTIITFGLFGLFTTIGFVLTKQRIDVIGISQDYKKIVEYSKITEQLLEEYRINSHENKNQLILLKSMVDKSDKDTHKYLNELIKIKEDCKYNWVNSLSNIPAPTLKGFLNYKLIEASNDGINITVDISEKIQKLDLVGFSVKNKEQIYTILGVFFDNAREAAALSKEKELLVQFVVEKKDLIIRIANTFEGEIDLGKIKRNGYSTKGKNRGIGLYIIDRIINSNPILKNETYLVDNYFTQELRIKVK